VGWGAAAGVRLAGRGSRASVSRARAYTHSAGAGESGLARIVELHFVSLAGDAAFTVSLAGTIFAIPTDQARVQVAQFLLLTMAPFALLAPFIGPLLDRFRHGRRWAIGTTLAARAFLCWVLADAVASHSAWVFPAALGCLVASRAYGVTRASAVPRVLPAGVSLVEANSRNALAGVVGMAVGGALAAAVAGFGAQWSLRLAFAIYVVGTVLAIRLPARVDSDVGEQDIADTLVLTPAGTPRRRHPLARLRARVAALPTTVLAAMCSAAGTRLLAGFLTLFVAFLMREHPLPGMSGTLTLVLVAGAAGVGNGLGTLVGNALGHRRPEVITAASRAGW
jgi:MFS family permease